MHWFAWDRLALPKQEGGLGFRDLESFNLVLLDKQTWRMLQYPESLMAKLLKGRYFHDSNILNAVQGKKASFIWKSILHGRDLVRKELRFCIGDGTIVDAWLDPWLPMHPPRPPIKTVNAPQQVMVRDLMNHTRSGWDIDKLNNWIAPQDIDSILQIKLCSTATEDLLGWHYTRQGFYTVKSGYWLATHTHAEEQVTPPPGNVLLKQRLRKLKTAPKIKHFFSRLLSTSLPTSATLREDETVNHLFFRCHYAQVIWRGSGIPNPIFLDQTAPWDDKIRAIFNINTSARTSHMRQLPLWIMWRLWKSRNTLMFQQQSIHWRKSLRLAKQDACEWQDAEDYVQKSSSGTRILPSTVNIQKIGHSHLAAGQNATMMVLSTETCQVKLLGLSEMTEERS
ncbi:hypothetical protein AtNW77_Chr2g0227581 [Arabidopsis thaliana]